MIISDDLKSYSFTIFSWIVFFNLAYQVLRRIISIPSKIAKNDIPKKKQSDFSHHVFSHLSFFHAVVSLIVSLYILTKRRFYYEEINQSDTLNLMSFSAGYYLSNSIVGFFYQFHPLSMICHHFVVLSEIFYSFSVGYYGNIIIAGFAIAETSNPFRIVKNICDGHEDKKQIGDCAIKTFATVFLIFRKFNKTPSFSNFIILCSIQSDSAYSKNERGRIVYDY